MALAGQCGICQITKFGARRILESENHVHNAFRRPAIAIGVGAMCHLLVFVGIPQEALGFENDSVGLRAHNPGAACFDALGPLGVLAQNENRLAERRGFFLNAARISENQVRTFQQVYKSLVRKRIDQMDSFAPLQDSPSGFPRGRVHVYGENDLHVRVASRNLPQSHANVLDRLPEALTAVCGHQQGLEPTN